MTDQRAWIHEGMTEYQRSKTAEMAKKLMPKQDLRIPGMTKKFLAIDEALRKLPKNRSIKLPKWVPNVPLGDHPHIINQNLFIFYPYYFDSKQFVETVQKANKDGFKVVVDSISSRAVGSNVRVIFWKPQKMKN